MKGLFFISGWYYFHRITKKIKFSHFYFSLMIIIFKRVWIPGVSENIDNPQYLIQDNKLMIFTNRNSLSANAWIGRFGVSELTSDVQPISHQHTIGGLSAHDNGAPSHFDRNVPGHLDATYPNRWIGRGRSCSRCPDILSQQRGHATLRHIKFSSHYTSHITLLQ